MDSQEYTDISRIHNAFLAEKIRWNETRKEEGAVRLPLTLSVLFHCQNFAAIVGTASLARSVGHDGFTALGAGDETGCANFPVGTTSLVASCLGNFTFRNSHDDTSLVQMPDGT